MSEMVERVAIALEDALSSAILNLYNSEGETWVDRDDYRHAARAALEAMRVPTPEMLKRGHLLDPLGCDVEEADIDTVYGAIWQAMIDAALK